MKKDGIRQIKVSPRKKMKEGPQKVLTNIGAGGGIRSTLTTLSMKPSLEIDIEDSPQLDRKTRLTENIL